MKLYLRRNVPPSEKIPVHGVDYRKGKDCGVAHEFMTRDCKPIFFTQSDFDDSHFQEEFVELTPFELGATIQNIVWGE